jgi:hypothetical protein
MQTQQARWQQAEHAYTTRIQEFITDEQRLLPALDATHCTLAVASQVQHNLSVKQNQMLTTRRTIEEHREYVGRRSKIVSYWHCWRCHQMRYRNSFERRRQPGCDKRLHYR